MTGNGQAIAAHEGIRSGGGGEPQERENPSSQFIDFMLKALVFWVMIAAIGLYLYSLYLRQEASLPAPGAVLPVDLIDENSGAVADSAEMAVHPAPDGPAALRPSVVDPVSAPKFIPRNRDAGTASEPGYRPLPEDQLEMIWRTFAPEYRPP